MEPMRVPNATTSRRLRVAGAALGLGLAISGAFSSARPWNRWPAGVVARVNGRPILETQVTQALRRIDGDGEPGAAPASTQVIERLIDEEILVQRAAEVDLIASDRSVSKVLVRAAIDAAVREARSQVPTERETQTFFDANRAVFASPRRVRVRCLTFGADDGSGSAWRRAEEAAENIAAGREVSFVAQNSSAGEGICAPEVLQPEAALRRQIGPALAQVALALSPGGVSTPIRTPGGIYVLQLAEEETPLAPAFETARERVRTELLRRKGDEALRSLLDRLRARATIILSEEAPRL
jgi:hypothetical protein